ncbi:MAG: radical SAM protein [Eubacteriales bacterium]|nr:radical SAM protein [Eubacteriales bacterium]
MGKTIKENIKSAAIKGILSYLDSSPEENIPKLINAVEMLDRNRDLESQIRVIRESFMDKSGNWHALFESLYADIDHGVRKKIFENFVINATLIELGRQKDVKEKNGCNVPWAILLDPASSCNLNCKGCWAAEYEENLNLPIHLWNSVIWQGKAHGTLVYLYSGGEPLVRKTDIVQICEEHNDCIFAAFTNATLIDENFANDILRMKNFVPIISVEGFQEETDSRRGEGVYAVAVKAMEILKRKKLLFTMDFWNDGEYVQGCIAGGRSYLHINANGDIEPCAFIHYSDSNIKEKTLLEAYKSLLFMQYYDNQPFNENHLRPCPLLDNPGRLSEMIEKFGASSTDLQNPEDVFALSAKCEHSADKWSEVADRLWAERQQQ